MLSVVALVLGAIVLVASFSNANEIEVEEFPGQEPFARLVIRNHCGPGTQTLEAQTSKGRVVVHFEENANGCSTQPDTFYVREWPDGVAVMPYEVELTEEPNGSPSEPGYIYLYSYKGL